MKRRYKNMDPGIRIVKYDTVCKETGVVLKKGTEALYYPLNRVFYSMESKQMQIWQEQAFDMDVEDNEKQWVM